jgi:hypothetical protein
MQVGYDLIVKSSFWAGKGIVLQPASLKTACCPMRFAG